MPVPIQQKLCRSDPSKCETTPLQNKICSASCPTIRFVTPFTLKTPCSEVKVALAATTSLGTHSCWPTIKFRKSLGMPSFSQSQLQHGIPLFQWGSFKVLEQNLGLLQLTTCSLAVLLKTKVYQPIFPCETQGPEQHHPDQPVAAGHQK